jgi:hypothetical protein
MRIAALSAGIACLIGCSSGNDPALAPPISGGSPDPKLTWGMSAQVAGTRVMRVDLVRERSGYSSGYAEIRNILFLDPSEKAGRWLLPDRQHYFAEHIELAIKAPDGEPKQVLGTVALVKAVGQESEAATGRLLAFDAIGKVIEPVAEGVRRLNAASVSSSGEFVVLYERNRQFVVAVVDPHTYRVAQQQAFEIPEIP